MTLFYLTNHNGNPIIRFRVTAGDSAFACIPIHREPGSAYFMLNCYS